MTRRNVFLPATFVVVYLGACLAFTRVWEVTHDEGITWLQAFGSLPLPRWPDTPVSMEALLPILTGRGPRAWADVVSALHGPEGMHPPAYYVLLKSWAGFFGAGPLAMAVPPMIWGVGSLFGMRRLAERVAGGPSAGLWAMGLLAVSPWLLDFSLLSRPYSLALFLGLAATNAVFDLTGSPGVSRARAAGVFAAISILGLYVLYHYAFVLVWHFAWLGLVAWGRGASRWRDLGYLAALGVVVCVGFAPWLTHLLAHLQRTGAEGLYFAGALAPAEWLAAGLQVLALFGVAEALQTDAGPVLLAGLAFLAAVSLPLAALSFWPRRGGSPELHTVALFWITAPVLPLSIGVADALHDTHTLFLTKTGFLLLPLLIALVVRGWLRADLGLWVSRAGLAAWLLLFVTASVADLRWLSTHDSPAEGAARAIAAHDDARHLVVLASPSPGDAIPLLLSMQRAGVREVAVAYANELRLRKLLESPETRARYRNLTLVNFVSTDPRFQWPDRRIERLRVEARAAGWRLAGDSAANQGQPADAPRLRILGPLSPKLRSM